MGPRPKSGRLSSEDLGLAGGLLPLLIGSLPGLPAVLPVLLGTYLTPGLVRDGGSPACDTEPEGLGLLVFSLGVAAFVFLALRSGPSSARTRAGSAPWLRPRQVWAPPVALVS